MPTQTPQAHSRLLGMWRSDRKPTIADWRFSKRLTPERRRQFLGIFGHLRIAYTRTHIRGVLRDYRYTQRYEVLASDSDSVAIRYEDTQLHGEWRIAHIHFEGRDRYWIALGHNREWFKRVAGSKRARGRRHPDSQKTNRVNSSRRAGAK